MSERKGVSPLGRAYGKIPTVLLLALIVFLFLLPYVAGKYVMYMTMHILVLSVFALGFNLLLGYTGLLSFSEFYCHLCHNLQGDLILDGKDVF